MNQLALNLAEGRKRRDDGIQRVKVRNSGWIELALAVLWFYGRDHKTFTAEEFRAHFLESGQPPTTHYAWGALFRTAAGKRRIIEPTGSYTPATSPKTHAHPVRVWRSLVFAAPETAGGSNGKEGNRVPRCHPEGRQETTPDYRGEKGEEESGAGTLSRGR